MIRELDQTLFYKCEKLIEEDGHVEVKAVIEGNNPGRVFVDDAESPKTGLIWLGNHDGFFFIGEEENQAFNNQINDFLDQVIFPEAKKLRLNNFIAIGNHSKWERTIERVFEHRPMQKSHQNVYRLEKRLLPAHHEPSIKPVYRVFKINEKLYENKYDSLENIEFLRSKISEFWSSPEDFFQKGIGYCVVHQKKMVSLCFSGFVAENVHGIDIETIEEHQGNKLGQKAAHCVVKDCASKGMVPYWDCEKSNKPSNVIAEKSGLNHYLHYFVYIFPIE
ncbi:GNAT family N-acetyltransferase [Halobacillus trueperi]|uniref:GNAT family N-acetyltransferase n=1 Tax=Halobacillus trueperi TaxID=156205 RepID=UPI00373522CF